MRTMATFTPALGLSDPRLLPPVTGGETRQQSVLEGLAALRKYEPDLVLIHDAARPLVDGEVVARRARRARDARRRPARDRP